MRGVSWLRSRGRAGSCIATGASRAVRAAVAAASSSRRDRRRLAVSLRRLLCTGSLTCVSLFLRPSSSPCSSRFDLLRSSVFRRSQRAVMRRLCSAFSVASATRRTARRRICCAWLSPRCAPFRRVSPSNTCRAARIRPPMPSHTRRARLGCHWLRCGRRPSAPCSSRLVH